MWNQRNRHTQKQEPEGRAVVAQAAAELQRSSYAAIRKVRCDFRDGVLTLSGRVPSYYQMQVAQTLVQFRLPGVAIRNDLRVLIRQFYESAIVCDEEPAVVSSVSHK